MRHKQKTYNFSNILAAVLMIMTLLWLTVSTPFVFASQEQNAAYSKANHADQSQRQDDDSRNPFANTTEEKAPSGGINSLSEEYLHHDNELFHIAELLLSHKRPHAVSEYTAYHGELLCPPPDFILS